jgi:hypothetical protein
VFEEEHQDVVYFIEEVRVSEGGLLVSQIVRKGLEPAQVGQRQIGLLVQVHRLRIHAETHFAQSRVDLLKVAVRVHAGYDLKRPFFQKLQKFIASGIVLEYFEQKFVEFEFVIVLKQEVDDFETVVEDCLQITFE